GGGRIAVERTIEAGAGAHGLRHGIRMRWEGTAPLRGILAEEWALGMFGSPEDVWAEAAGRRVPLHEPGTLPEARRVTVTEGRSGLALTFDLSTPAAVWCFPIFTISNSEGGFEQNFQGAVLLHSWSLDLASGDAWQESTRCQITFQRRQATRPPRSAQPAPQDTGSRHETGAIRLVGSRGNPPNGWLASRTIQTKPTNERAPAFTIAGIEETAGRHEAGWSRCGKERGWPGG